MTRTSPHRVPGSYKAQRLPARRNLEIGMLSRVSRHGMLLVSRLAEGEFGADGSLDELLDFAPAVVTSVRRHVFAKDTGSGPPSFDRLVG